MTPFRQLILPGDVGSDVRAVKRAMQKAGTPGAGGLVVNGKGSGHAGEAFVSCLNRILRNHGKRQDGKYGRDAHAIVAPHFDLYGVALYRAAKIRDRKPPPAPVFHLGARAAAARLLDHERAGRYRADNPGDHYDLVRTAAGEPVWSRGGRWVYLDQRPLDLLLWLIEDHHFKLGTFALCSDHHFDGWNGHSGGHAVDISSINGEGVGSGGARASTLAVARLTHEAPSTLRPWQLICDGYGQRHDSEIAALTIPSAGFYGYSTMAGHRNHLHAGYHG